VQEQIARLKSEGRLIDAQYAAQITHAAAGLLDAQRAEALRGVIDDAVRIVDRQRHTAQRTAELTAREREVAELIAAGLSNPQIAEALVVSIRTVESHINKLMKKIGARERSDVRQYLIREGLTQAWS
jgi:DNA-binding NarL/FixJ family response regulator